jgi:hypothetical protein
MVSFAALVSLSTFGVAQAEGYYDESEEAGSGSREEASAAAEEATPAESTPASEEANVPSETTSFLEGTTGCDACGDPCCACEEFDCCDCYNNRERLFGMLPSDHCFDDFISPLSNPFFFEDPRSLTEVRGIFIDNALPDYLTGGDAQVWGLQLRGRLSDRWSVIAPRLAYFQVNQQGTGNPVGLLSVPVGVKYNFYRDVDQQALATAGITYFIPGAQQAAAGFGDGDMHIFLTGGKRIFDRGHWLSGTGFRLPLDRNWGTQFWYWSNQWDYELPNHIYPLVGVNWFHFMSNATNNVTGGIAGFDLLNLPTDNVTGRNVVSGVIGLKWKPTSHLEVGGGYEFPMSFYKDILQNRAYADLIFRY